tara:strand:+ start:1027 stop:1803 length:777 start_codon:yes stop_codon:yes gene_type:complete
MNLKDKFFDLFNLYIEKKTSKKDISRVLKKLLPYKIDKKLIRLGDQNDGGYLIPNDIEGIKKNYSAGIGNLTKFEMDLEQKYSIISYMFDFNEIDQKILPKRSKFFKKKIGIISLNDKLSMNDLLDNEEGEIICKIDIEGDEYLTLTSISEQNLNKIRILVIEIHDLRHLRNYFFFKSFEKIIDKLNKNFHICHLHPNNVSKVKNVGGYDVPDMLELTLIRKDRIKNFKEQFSDLPHQLDQKTVLTKNEIFIDKKWYL